MIVDLPTWLKVTYYVLLVIGALASWGFVARYAYLYRWWTTEIGRHFVAMSACLGSFYTYYTVALIWPELPGKAWIRGALFLCMTTAICWRLVMFERMRRAPKLKDEGN